MLSVRNFCRMHSLFFMKKKDKYKDKIKKWSHHSFLLLLLFCQNASFGKLYPGECLQSVTKYIETWSKPVNIFKTFERVQYISTAMSHSPSQCCVWGTNYVNHKNCLSTCSKIFTQQ